MKSNRTNASAKSLTAREGVAVPRRHQKVTTFFRRLSAPQRRSLAVLCGTGDDPEAANALLRKLIDWIGKQP